MISISFRPIIVRLLLILVMAVGLGYLSWMAIRTAIGDSLVTYVQRTPKLSAEAKMQGVDMAVRYSPADPMTRWMRAGVYFNAANEELMEDKMQTSIDELRGAAKMSPEDYRVWLALGRVLDRSGSLNEARSALDKAMRLAPNHFDTRWAMGNYLLRAGDRDGSFAQMRLALANRPSALPLVFDYAWNVYQGDGKAIAASLNPPVELKAQLAAMLIAHGKVDDGLAVWREISSPTQKDIQRVTESLVNTGRFSAAYQLWSAANVPDRPSPDPGSLLANGGFEQKFAFNSNLPFHSWRVTPVGGLRITLDRKDAREGAQAMRVGFEVSGNVAFTIASQTVPAQPKKKYCLSLWAKTDELESLSTPFVEVFDSADINRARAATPTLSIRSTKWSEYEVAVDTAPATEALTVRLQRNPCPDPICPIKGRLWIDELRLYECAGPKKPEKTDPLVSAP